VSRLILHNRTAVSSRASSFAGKRIAETLAILTCCVALYRQAHKMQKNLCWTIHPSRRILLQIKDNKQTVFSVTMQNINVFVETVVNSWRQQTIQHHNHYFNGSITQIQKLYLSIQKVEWIHFQMLRFAVSDKYNYLFPGDFWKGSLQN